MCFIIVCKVLFCTVKISLSKNVSKQRREGSGSVGEEMKHRSRTSESLSSSTRR